MDIDMILEALRESLQSLEDIKTEVSEQQEEIRKTMSLIEAMVSLDVECEGCHKKFLVDEMIETEFGYYCHDCHKDRMEIEDRNINE